MVVRISWGFWGGCGVGQTSGLVERIEEVWTVRLSGVCDEGSLLLCVTAESEFRELGSGLSCAMAVMNHLACYVGGKEVAFNEPLRSANVNEALRIALEYPATSQQAGNCYFLPPPLLYNTPLTLHINQA